MITAAYWVPVGLLMACLHLLLLARVAGFAKHLAPQEARNRFLRGLPFRLLLWTPVLAFAAQSGLQACLGIVVGSFLGRQAALLYHLRHQTET